MADNKGNPGEQHHEIVFFVDGVQFKVNKTSMTGAEIKALAGKDAQYQLYLEQTGDQPDKEIKDTEAVSLHNGMHFYAIPPATFGAIYA